MSPNAKYAALKKVDWEPLHDRVYGRLRDALMDAQFRPGARLSLRALAQKFDVSVMPVRAAVLRLVAEKALFQESNGHFVVPEISQPEFEEILYLRTQLEGIAAEKAARKRSEIHLKELKKIAAKLTESAEINDSVAYLQMNRDFKFTVVEAAQSPVLRDLIESLWTRIGPFMCHYAKDIRHQAEIDRHHDVVNAIANRNATAAREAISRDIIDGAKFLREVAGFDVQLT